MGASHRSVKLACPNCAREGHATWEHEGRVNPRRLYDLSAGFLGIDIGAQDGPRIVCQSCRVTVEESPL